MIAISQHDRRVIILGTSVLLILVGASRIGPRTITWYRGTWASARSLVTTGAQEEASIRALPLTRDSLVARNVRLASLDSAILDGKTPALAAATLSELMSDYAEETKAQLGNVEVRIDSTSTSTVFVIIGVHASLRGDLASIMRLLARVESGPALLAVRELDITSEGDPSISQTSAETLRAEVTLEGLARSPSAGGAQR